MVHSLSLIIEKENQHEIKGSRSIKSILLLPYLYEINFNLS